jgi:sulfur carrier protein
MLAFAVRDDISYTSEVVIKVTVNGESRELEEGTTLRALVEQFKLTPEKVAIELNRRLVRSEKYDTPLKTGDEVEIVTFVGGG